MNDIPMIKPKRVNDTYEGQRYELIYDVNAPVAKQWFWVVHYTHVSDIIGGAATLEAARRSARRSIREMKKHVGRTNQ